MNKVSSNTKNNNSSRSILSIRSSVLGEASVSNQLSDELIAALQSDGAEYSVIERNFQQQAVPHVDGAWLQALMTAKEDRDAEQQQQVEYSDELIAEVMAADVLILALPMYNFTVPSMLKAWIDHIARAGVTFKYTDKGAEGLLKDKKVYFVTAMGGVHEAGVSDFLRPYMKMIMAFLGIEDVEFITADGLNMGEERRALGLTTARKELKLLLETGSHNHNELEEVA